MSETRPNGEHHMRSAVTIDGRAMAAEINIKTGLATAALLQRGLPSPGLVVVLVGNHAPSEIYVRNKLKASEQIGIKARTERFDEAVTTCELLAKFQELNDDPLVSGIIVQLPLPSHIDRDRVINAISPDKDVDGFTTRNAGDMFLGIGQPLLPCTPQGCITLVKSVIGPRLTGLHALVVGCSNIVGKPLAMLLLQEGCTVSIAHVHTVDLPSLARAADLLCVATGCAGLVNSTWIKPGAIVIDVGINRVVDEQGNTRIVGDVVFDEVLPHVRAITPVPGGVGPMTIAYLLRNTLISACRHHGIEPNAVISE